MKFDAYNFLTMCKNIVTGGGRTASGLVKQDCGFAKDMNFGLNDLIPAVVDSSTGTASTTIAAGVGVQTISFQHTFIGGTSAVEPVTNYTPGFKFKILSWSAVTSVLLVGAAGSRVANMEINTTDVGTVPSTITVAIANAAVGTVTAGTAVAGANTGSATDTISIEIANGGTQFTAGSVTFQIVIQNMDVADAVASLSAYGLAASETNLKVFSAPAGVTAVGALTLVIPRDYDEATDTFALKVTVAMAGSTDTSVTLTGAAYRKRPGSSIATVATGVAGKNVSQTSTVTLTTASQIVEFNFSQNGLRRDDAITIVLTSAAHTTDAILLYSIEPVYRSTLVSYAENDGTTRDSGNPLR